MHVMPLDSELKCSILVYNILKLLIHKFRINVVLNNSNLCREEIAVYLSLFETGRPRKPLIEPCGTPIFDYLIAIFFYSEKRHGVFFSA